MKPLSLLSCLAVTAAAASAELTDPNKVASEWNSHISASSAPLIGPLDLQAQVADQRYPGLTNVFQSAGATPPNLAPPEPRLYDAPATQARPDPLSPMPRGAKRWRFNGSDYWLVPLGP